MNGRTWFAASVIASIILAGTWIALWWDAFGRPTWLHAEASDEGWLAELDRDTGEPDGA
jgi:hypothetical protein